MIDANETDASVPCRPRLHVDLTTALQERHRIAHGTIRVERGIVGALAAMREPDVVFCHYARGAARFSAVVAEEAAAIAAADGQPEARRTARPPRRLQPVLDAGKKIELWVRGNIRDPWRARMRARRIERAAESWHGDDMFVRGDVLLVPGELQRHDFATLSRLKRQLGVRLAFVFYDLLDVLEADDPRLRDDTAFDLPSSDFIMREADAVLAISDYSRRTLLAHCAARGFSPPRTRVIPLGHDVRRPGAVAPPQLDLEPGAFVLSVGDVTPRKNHALLIEVWRALAERMATELATLVIVGRIDPACAALVATVEQDVELAGRIKFLSNVADPALDWLYDHCRFTVFPSLSEGFGLPVAESLARGKVCVASSATSLPEASQGRAIHLDPHTPAAWIEAIGPLMRDDDALVREVRRIEGFRTYTWRDTAEDALAFLATR